MAKFSIEHTVPDDIRRIEIIEAQNGTPGMRAQCIRALAHPGVQAYTAFVDDEPVFIGALVPIWHGRSVCWSLIGTGFYAVKKSVTRAVHRFMARQNGRIEVSTVRDNIAAADWVARFGFEIEAQALKYFPDGSDATLWVRHDDGL